MYTTFQVLIGAVTILSIGFVFKITAERLERITDDDLDNIAIAIVKIVTFPKKIFDLFLLRKNYNKYLKRYLGTADRYSSDSVNYYYIPSYLRPIYLRKQQALQEIKAVDETIDTIKKEKVAKEEPKKDFTDKSLKELILEIRELGSKSDYEISKSINNLTDVITSINEKLDNKNINKRLAKEFIPQLIKQINRYQSMKMNKIEYNIDNIKNEQNETIELITNAFKNNIKEIYDNIKFDMQVDLDVIKKLLKMKGLVKDNLAG